MRNRGLNHLIRLTRRLGRSPPAFSSEEYWKRRYAEGGNSGPGSYDHLAEFKAAVINRFVEETDCASVIEFGCGDGNQLRYADYRHYLGFDVSSEAVELCRRMFSDDTSKHFALVDDYDGGTADLAMSLDVIFHLVEDDVFDAYMYGLFEASSRFVVIYSSDTDDQMGERAPHVKHRNFTQWILKNKPDWQLVRKVENPYPYIGDFKRTSFSDFYFFARAASLGIDSAMPNLVTTP